MFDFKYWLERPDVPDDFLWKFDMPKNVFNHKSIWIEAVSEADALEKFKEIKEYHEISPMPQEIKVHFENGDYLTTRINATLEEATKYYVGNTFNIGLGPNDNMVKAIRIELI